MIEHLGFGSSDIDASRTFFRDALAPLGIGIVVDGEHGIGFGKDKTPQLWIAPAKDKPTPVHLAFSAASRAEVDAFHAAALKAGGTDNGAPGLRAKYAPNYYGAFVLSPDGHNVEAVFRDPEIK